MEERYRPSATLPGGCFAYSVSQSPWESSYCTLWDPESFTGPGGDGVGSRECHVLPEDEAELYSHIGWRAHKENSDRSDWPAEDFGGTLF